MLADEDSAVIERFGILNTLVDPDDDLYGIPFPGSYLVDQDGTVLAKHFNQHYRVRETAAALLRGDLDAPFDDSGFPAARSPADSGGAVTVTLGAADLKPYQRGEFLVQIDLGDGLHVYGPDAPDGYVATDVRVSGPEGFDVEPALFPSTRPFRVDGIDEQFEVLDGEIRIAVPFVYAVEGAEPGSTVPVDIEVRYQACNEHECLLPRTERVHMDLTLGALNHRAARPG